MSFKDGPDSVITGERTKTISPPAPPPPPNDPHCLAYFDDGDDDYSLPTPKEKRKLTPLRFVFTVIFAVVVILYLSYR